MVHLVYPEVSALFGKNHGNGFVINNATDLSMFLLDVAHVALVPVLLSEDDKYIRFS